MSNFAEKANNKFCVLTDQGLQKILAKKKQMSDTEFANDFCGVYRETLTKIINKKVVNISTLEKVFSNLDITPFEDSYFQCFPQDQIPEEHRNTKSRSNQRVVTNKTNNNIDIPLSNQEIIEKALLTLNYDEQKFCFKTKSKSIKPAAAFIVQGNSGYGQRWLVNLLSYEIPYNVNALTYSIHIKPHRKDINYILESLAKKLETNSSPQEIQEEIYKHLETNSVILAIHDVDYLIANNCLKQFIESFWMPLVETVKNKNSPYRIVLFLVDNKNSISQLQEILTSMNFKNPLPVFLPNIEDFNIDLVEMWVGTQGILSQLQWHEEESMEQVMKHIVTRDTKPIDFFKSICECFDLQWSDIENTLSL